MKKYLQSVIMPVYNAEKYINEAVNSVLSQTYDNIELVVVNDGSTDKSYDILQEYEKKDKRIKLFNFKKNRGACAALNYALDHVNGNYVSWLSADDKYDQNMIESSIEYLEQHKCFDAVFSKHIFIDDNAKEIERWIPPNEYRNIGISNNTQPYRNLIFCGNSFNACTVVAKTESFIKTGYFNDNHQYAGDYDYMMRLASVANIGFLDKYTVYSRVHDGQVTKKGRNEIDAIHVFEEMIFNDSIRKNLFQKANVTEGLIEITSAILNRFNIYKNMNMENEAKEVDALYQKFLNLFEPVVKANSILKKMETLLNMGDIVKLQSEINSIPDEIKNYLDQERYMIIVASMYEQIGMESEEKKILENILKINPSNYEALFMLGIIFEKNNQIKEALKNYTNSYLNSSLEDKEIILQNLKRFTNEKL